MIYWHPCNPYGKHVPVEKINCFLQIENGLVQFSTLQSCSNIPPLWGLHWHHDSKLKFTSLQFLVISVTLYPLDLFFSIVCIFSRQFNVTILIFYFLNLYTKPTRQGYLFISLANVVQIPKWIPNIYKVFNKCLLNEWKWINYYLAPLEILGYHEPSTYSVHLSCKNAYNISITSYFLKYPHSISIFD